MSVQLSDASLKRRREAEKEEEQDDEAQDQELDELEDDSEYDWAAGSNDETPYDYDENPGPSKRAKVEAPPPSDFLRQIKHEEDTVKHWGEVVAMFDRSGHSLVPYLRYEEIDFKMPKGWDATLARVSEVNVKILTPGLQLDDLFTTYAPYIFEYLSGLRLIPSTTDPASIVPTQEDYDNFGDHFAIPQPIGSPSTFPTGNYATLAGICELLVKIESLLLTHPPSPDLIRSSMLRSQDLDWVIERFKEGSITIDSKAAESLDYWWDSQRYGLDRMWDKVMWVLLERKAVKWAVSALSEEQHDEVKANVVKKWKARKQGAEEVGGVWATTPL